MRKHVIAALTVVMVLGLALAAWAQQDNARQQRWEKWRKAQQQAADAIVADAAKIKADMEAVTQALQNRQQQQDLSEEQRTALRETWRKRREERRTVLADLTLQIAKLKGQRQLKREHDKAMEELKAIRELATSEKATQTAASLGKLIDDRQTEFEKTLVTLGFDQ